MSLRISLGLLACVAAALPADAQPVPYPVKLVALVTHSSPGGGSDVFLREMVKVLPKYIDATFIVENVQGGSGARAMTKVATAKPDGATLYAITPTYVFTTLLSKVPHGYKDLEPLVVMFADAEVLYTRADGPLATLKDVIDKAKASRGRWGVANPASLERQVAERLKRAAGINVAIVSHEGGGDMMIGVLNGTYDIGIGEVQELQGQLEAGKIRLLATMSESRLAGLPNLPTAKEQGLNVVIRKFRGIASPKGLPDAVAKTWEDAIRKVVDLPAYKAEYTKDHLTPMVLGRAEARKFTADVAAETAASFKEMGLTK